MIASVLDYEYKNGIEDIDLPTKKRIEFFLESTKPTLLAVVGHIEESQKEEQIDLCDIKNRGQFYLMNPEIKSIDEINGITYTGVLGQDYLILPPNKRKVQVKDIDEYLTNLEFNYVSVKYTAGYAPDEIPADLKLAHIMVVEGMLASVDGKEIKEEKVGDRTIKFTSDSAAQEFKNIVSQYNRFII